MYGFAGEFCRTEAVLDKNWGKVKCGTILCAIFVLKSDWDSKMAVIK